jgi:ABC-2 type transport system permease protein
MSKILTVVSREYLERVRSKSFLIGTILGPALMSMFIVIPLLTAGNGGKDQRTIAVIDQSGDVRGPLAAVLAEEGHKNLTLQPVEVGPGGLDAAVADVKREILAGNVHSGLVVPADFTRTGKVAFYNKSVSSLVVRDDMLRPALDRVMRERRFAGAAVPDSLFEYLSARTEWNSVAVTADGEAKQDDAVPFAMAFVLIMIIYMMVLMYGNHTLTAVIEEKSSRMVEILLSSVSPGNLMLGKVLGIGLAGLTQFAIWTLAFFLISQRGLTIGDTTLDVSFLTPTILVSFVMFFLLGFFLYATLYAGVGSMCNTIQDSQQFHLPLTMGLIIPMMMLTAVLRDPNSTMATVLSLVPLFSPVLMFMRVCVETPPLWQILLSWVLMALSIWVSARAAGKLFRIGILMYGQAPTWATLGRALRS